MGLNVSSLYQLAYQASPIVLVNGIAQVAGGLLPIIAITESLQIIGGAFTGSVPTSLDDFFAQFLPVSGSTLISNTIGEYPFANQAIAANAIIQQPLSLSMRMIAPARNTGDLILKLPIFTALQTALVTHNNLGGLYHIATPAFLYLNCIMTGMTDVTPGDGKQLQVEYQLDFQQPLVTQTQAQNALNSLMGKIAGGNQITGNPTWSGPDSAIGFSAQGVPALPDTTNITGAPLTGSL